MLNFSPYEVWLLQPLILWGGLEERYLSWNTEVKTYVDSATLEILLSAFTSATACGLVRLVLQPVNCILDMLTQPDSIASHFLSPRAKTPEQRQDLIMKLEKTQFFQTTRFFAICSCT